MTNLYTLDHSCITGYLRNYGPIKQYFFLLPYNNTSRPLIVPQEDLVHFDDFLLPCNIPTQIVKPLMLLNISYLLHSTKKTKPTIQLYTNKLTPTMNFSSLQQKPFRLWYKQNKTQNTNHTLLQSKTLRTNFPLS